MINAFSLIESIIYIFISTFLFSLFLFYSHSLHYNTRKTMSKNQDYIQNLTGFLYLDNELRNAEDINLNSQSQIYYFLNNNLIKWYVKNNKLIRQSSQLINNKAVNKSHNLIISSLNNLHFEPITIDGYILGVKYLLKFDKLTEIEGLVAFRLGKIL